MFEWIVFLWLFILTVYALWKPGRIGPIGFTGPPGRDGECKCENE